jgi:hypothetical protein
MAELTPEERAKKGLVGTGEVLFSAAMVGVAVGAALTGGHALS